MGNRGCLHDEQGRIRRPFQLQRWIICVLAFKGRQRTVMTPGQYTELFFLDEATALAAGHRPCAECSRGRFTLLRELWAMANPELAGGPRPAAPVIDAALHRERCSPQGAKQTYTAALAELPAGVFVIHPSTGTAHLWWQGQLWPWQPAGYDAPLYPPLYPVAALTVQVLTPPSIVRTLTAGYPVSTLMQTPTRAYSSSPSSSYSYSKPE
jgi:hypothetical protein